MVNKKRIIVFLTVIFSLMAFAGCSMLSGLNGASAKIVVCVGDSITQGVGVTDASTSSYPAQLSKKLGSNYQVLNYGVGGTTVLDGDSAYTATSFYNKALRSGASVVIIALGTNDCRTDGWDADAFETAYQALVNEIYHAKADADIILVLPSPIYITAYNYDDEILRNEMIPIIRKIADEYGFKTVDAYSALEGKESLFTDGLHPNEKGAALLARLVKKAINQ